MLLSRERQILELLAMNSETMTTSELAAALQVSSRTIKSDLSRLRTQLEGTGCLIETKTGKGLWLVMDEKGKEFIDEIMFKNEVSLPSSIQTRRFHVALHLLDAENYISMEEIADMMYVSKGTVVNDINDLIPYFEDLGLEVDKRVKYGIRIIGSESQLRIARAYMIQKIVLSQGTHLSSELQPFFVGIDLDAINTILQDAEEKFEFVLSDTSYKDLLVHLAIIIIRLRKGEQCEILDEELISDKSKTEWKISEYIGLSLNEIFDVSLSDGDVSYIMLNIVGARLLTVIYSRTETDALQESPEKFEMWRKIVKQTSEKFGTCLYCDDTFTYALFIHITAMFNRLKHGIFLENPLKKTIREDLVFEFEVGTHLAKLIEVAYGYALGEDEICDIALYIGASIERDKASRIIENPRVTLVCGSGLGTSQFFEAKLKLLFPNIEVVSILPLSHVKSSLKVENQDFVISTVPLKLDNIEVINVTPMLNMEDIRVIDSILHPDKITSISRESGNYPVISGLLRKDIMTLNYDCRSRNEVIRLLGSRLNDMGYVDDEYIESTFNREMMAATSIGDTFAIPHAFEGHILKQGIGFMTTKKPIKWGEEKVQIILMLSIDTQNMNSFQEIFGELVNLVKDYSRVEQILMAKSFEEIIQILK